MLLPFVIFAVLMLIVLLVALYMLYPGSRKISTIPGLEPSNEADGNIPDIAKAGSMAEFLIDLHKEFGPIVSFWIGREFIVSVASAALFKEVSHLFDRPVSLYKSFEPLIGAQSIEYRNGPEGQHLRKIHDRSFTQSSIEAQRDTLQKICEELCAKWTKMSSTKEHVPLSIHMSAVVIKSLARYAFGDYFKDEKALLAFRKNYDNCFSIMENTLVDGPMKPGSDKQKLFNEGMDGMKETVKEIIKQREAAEVAPEDKCFIDSLLDTYDNEDMVFDDAITYLVGGSHTTTYYLTWTLYFLATHADMQEKVYQEIVKHYKGGPVTVDVMKNMRYLQNVMNESMRLSKLAPFAARFSSHDMLLGGHKVLKETPIVTSIGTIMEDETIWKNPKEFNPDRFDTKPPAYAFVPFGFAGKRQCPGYRLTEIMGQIFLVLALSKFKVSMVPGQVVESKYGLVTKPAEEIWITVEQRSG